MQQQFQFRLPFPPGKIWGVLSQTDWVNRSLGLPPVTYDFQPLPQGGTDVTATARWHGFVLRWREEPFEWIEPEFYSVHRVFETGPFREMDLRWIFTAEGGELTRIDVIANIQPRTVLGEFLVKTAFGWKLRRDLQKMLGHFERHLRGMPGVVLPNLPRAAIAEGPMTLALGRLRKSGLAPELIEQIEKLIRERNDIELAHLRPLAIAKAWGEDPWKVLQLFLHATRSGLLNFSWEILCPNCRTAPEKGVASLGALKNSVHCEACQIRFDGEFDRSIELKFSVHPAIKSTSLQTFCLAGPGTKPHITWQRLLPPGGRLVFPSRCRVRGARLRSPQVGTRVDLDDLPNGSASVAITCRPAGFEVRPAGAGAAELEFLNPNPFPVQLICEERHWPEDVLTAARVTNWQEYRDLFSAEVISPNEQITVGSQVVLFTDLKGSTAMYSHIGDSPAYALVRTHFEILVESIRQHHGTLIKTIGDAVMGGFTRVDEALLAVEQMHKQLAAAFGEAPGRPELHLKSSLHVGPCLAVNANDRLDFFGSTVNLAARLVECCRGGDLAITVDVYERPETRALIGRLGEEPQAAEVRLKGFAEPFRVWLLRIVPTGDGRKGS